MNLHNIKQFIELTKLVELSLQNVSYKLLVIRANTTYKYTLLGIIPNNLVDIFT